MTSSFLSGIISTVVRTLGTLCRSLVDLKKQGGDLVFLKGNHEKMLMDYYIHQKDQMLYVANGGAETIASYVEGGIGRKAFVLPEDHLEFLLGLQLYYETEDYIFVHAGLRDEVPLANRPRKISSGSGRSSSTRCMSGERGLSSDTRLSKPPL